MKTIVLVLLMSLSASVSGQTLYAYYYGYEEGFHKACGCNKQIPMSNNLLYNSGTRNEGYNAGFTDGRIYLSQVSNQQQSNRQLYSPDMDLIYQALAQKQAQLDQRRQTIQSAYDNILDILVAVASKRSPNGLTQPEKDYISTFLTLAKQYSSYDLTNTTTYNQIVNWFYEQKMHFLKW